ncbi:MAG: cell division septum initiation protein DivIVA [Myxococcota bacterium]|jgi:cell division septum initiation protein DivIVA
MLPVRFVGVPIHGVPSTASSASAWSVEMPRWAEAISLATIAIVAVVALLVYAKFTTQKAKKRASAAVESNKALLAASRSIPDIPPIEIDAPRRPRSNSLSDIDRAAVRVATSKAPVEALPSPGPSASKKPAPAVPPKTVMGPPLEASNLATHGPPASVAIAPAVASLFMGPPAHAAGGDADTLRAAAEKTALEVAGTKPEKAENPSTGVKPGSAEELALVERAQSTLEKLHNLRLRSDIAPAVALQESEKLQEIMSKLSPETARELQSLIENGYNKRITADPNGGPVAAAAGDIRAAESGRYDDTPSDVRALRERNRALRQKLGAPSQVRPVTRPQVNPSTLPAAKPQGLTTDRRRGSLPSVEARSL